MEDRLDDLDSSQLQAYLLAKSLTEMHDAQDSPVPVLKGALAGISKTYGGPFGTARKANPAAIPARSGRVLLALGMTIVDPGAAPLSPRAWRHSSRHSDE